MPGLKKIYELWAERHDQPIWIIVREPKLKVIAKQGGRLILDPTREDPYSVEEIAVRCNRGQSSVTGSLKRLEKRRKVKDVHGGWMRT